MAAPVSRLRADARHNRDRIITVARELFAERGLDVPMAAIARRAGVGVATLYRRFPAKESLVTEVFEEQFADCVGILSTALDDQDPWHGFCLVIEEVCARQAADRGFSSAFLAVFPDAVDIASERVRGLAEFATLIRRAQDCGALRPDFALDDLTLVLMANSGIVADSAEVAVAASRRLIAYLLEAFRATPGTPLPPPVPLNLHDVAP